MTTRRGPDVARGPDVVHHCSTGTILSVPFCPYHFVPYHFVLEPYGVMCAQLGCLAAKFDPCNSVLQFDILYFTCKHSAVCQTVYQKKNIIILRCHALFLMFGQRHIFLEDFSL